VVTGDAADHRDETGFSGLGRLGRLGRGLLVRLRAAGLGGDGIVGRLRNGWLRDGWLRSGGRIVVSVVARCVTAPGRDGALIGVVGVVVEPGIAGRPVVRVVVSAGGDLSCPGVHRSRHGRSRDRLGRGGGGRGGRGPERAEPA
jgi:hypothetical protein